MQPMVQFCRFGVYFSTWATSPLWLMGKSTGEGAA